MDSPVIGNVKLKTKCNSWNPVKTRVFQCPKNRTQNICLLCAIYEISYTYIQYVYPKYTLVRHDSMQDELNIALVKTRNK